MLQSISIYFKKERPEWPRLHWRLFSLRWPHSPAYHTKSQSSSDSLPENCSLYASQTCVHDVPYRKWTHCAFPGFLQNTGSSALLSTLFLKRSSRLFHRLYETVQNKTLSLNMNYSSCPFFQMTVHSSGSSGQHFAWYYLTQGTCLLCRPSRTHKVCVSPIVLKRALQITFLYY